MSAYGPSKTTGRYPNGKRVKLFVRAGRWWLHIEVGPWAFGVVA